MQLLIAFQDNQQISLADLTPMPETLARVFQRTQNTDNPMVEQVTPRTYTSWSDYFAQQKDETTAMASTSQGGTRPLQVQPQPRPFTPMLDPITVGLSVESEMEMENLSGDTEPNSPKHLLTPLEQMDKDDMHRLHPTLPLNADLEAAGDTSIQLTEEQHRILMSQSEGSTIIYETRENRQQVEEVKMVPNFTSGEQATLTSIRDTLHMGIHLEGLNGDEPPDIEQLVQDDDPPILRAFVQELEHWPEVDQFLDETFGENR